MFLNRGRWCIGDVGVLGFILNDDILEERGLFISDNSLVAARFTDGVDVSL